jgi:hypothetical protein
LRCETSLKQFERRTKTSEGREVSVDEHGGLRRPRVRRAAPGEGGSAVALEPPWDRGGDGVGLRPVHRRRRRRGRAAQRGEGHGDRGRRRFTGTRWANLDLQDAHPEARERVGGNAALPSPGRRRKSPAGGATPTGRHRLAHTGAISLEASEAFAVPQTSRPADPAAHSSLVAPAAALAAACGCPGPGPVAFGVPVSFAFGVPVSFAFGVPVPVSFALGVPVPFALGVSGGWPWPRRRVRPRTRTTDVSARHGEVELCNGQR